MRQTALWSALIGAGLLAGCQAEGNGGTTPTPEPEPAATAGREPAAPAIEDPAPAVSPSVPDIEIERDPAPDFDVRLLDGAKRVKLSDYRGSVVLLSFWGID